MFIKSITFSGFTSYRPKTSLEKISPGLNVIVGRNGSGKSNFFSAIRFLLGDLWGSLSQQDRQSLIYSGGSSTTLQASVEVVFDNTDKRFPTCGDTVTIRRTVSARRDEYMLDGKAVTKDEIRSHFESAGFNRANPFYIVPQGKVTSLTNASDKDRLELLLAVSGASVYDAKRAQSLKLLQESDTKLGLTGDKLEHIDTRLHELESEVEDLEAFISANDTKHAVEYELLSREGTRLDELLQQDQAERQERFDEREELCTALTTAEVAAETAQATVATSQHELEVAQADLQSAEDRLRDLQADATSIQSSLASEKTHRQAAASDNEIVDQLQARVDELQLALTKAQDGVMPLRTKLEQTQSRIRVLQLKRGRQAAFTTADERDRWLHAQIAELQEDCDAQTAATATARVALEAADARAAAATAKIEAADAELTQAKARASEVGKRYDAARSELDATESERNRAQLKHKKATILDTSLAKEIELATATLDSVVPSDVLRGAAATRQIVKDLGLQDKFYGQVSELITVDKPFVRALESVGSHLLFYCVVDDLETSQQIVQELVARRAGTCAFIPLEQIRNSSSSVRREMALRPMEGTRLIDHIEIEERFQPVVNMLYGRVVVCPDLNNAKLCATKYSALGITLNGDQVNANGTVRGGGSSTGGGGSKPVMAFAAIKRAGEAQIKREQNSTELEELAAAIQQLNYEVTAKHNVANSASIAVEQARIALHGARDEVVALRGVVDEAAKAKTAQERELARLGSTLAAAQTEMQSLKAGLEATFVASLSAEEHDELQQLLAVLKEITPQEDAASAELVRAEQQYTEAEAALVQAQAQADEASKTRWAEQHAVVPDEHRLTVVQQAIRDLEARLQELTRALEAAQKTRAAADEQVAAASASCETAARTLVRHDRHTERTSVKRQGLEALQKDNLDKRAALGQISAQSFSKLSSLSVEQLAAQLAQANEELAGFSSVNRRSIEQHQAYTAQLEELRRRQTELTEDVVSLRSLIQQLDSQKQRAVLRTFKGVAKAFEGIIHKLSGHSGQLVMQKPAEGAELVPGLPFSGVSIRTSLGRGEGYVDRLSGGQKTLCALSLIFAIQACDPVPFYIFDEIDANLDPAYRQSVAQMIRKASHDAQFICTTFRPELVKVADQCYGVSFEKGTSTILPVDDETALGFVDVSAETAEASITSE